MVESTKQNSKERLVSLKTIVSLISKDYLFSSFPESNFNLGALLPLHTRSQNAGTSMTSTGDTIQVESFELSPQNETVMRALGRIRRTFLDPGLAFDRVIFEEPDSKKALAHTLAQMSRQYRSDTMVKIMKAGELHDEDRDTSDPKMITEFFMSVLRPDPLIFKLRRSRNALVKKLRGWIPVHFGIPLSVETGSD